ncbi:Uma2 family endonuclease [Candidatus Binatia bacterium]|nr:Uma2 family endonuclease [Candidatus Binatia bacterium]
MVDGSGLMHGIAGAILSPVPGPAHHVHYERAEFVTLEASSNVKHEFFDGQIYAMAGGNPEHAALAAAVVGLLFPQLRGGRCRIHDADLRVRVLATGLTTYPDVSIVFGPLERDPDDDNAITNPTVVVEVLSRSSEAYDRGDKFEHYKHIATLRQYVLVSQHERQIEVWTRDDKDLWARTMYAEGSCAALGSIRARLDVSDLYNAATAPLA